MFDGDELAGMVDCFGALTRDQLRQACSETAFRRGEDLDEAAVRDAIDDALAEYALVEHDGALVVGPTAFPTLPPGAEDLTHIMDVDPQSVDRAAVAGTVAEQFREDVREALDGADVERCRTVLDRSYDVESWGPVDVSEERDRLDERLATLADE